MDSNVSQTRRPQSEHADVLFFICIDECSAGTASGQLWSLCAREPVGFKSLDGMLLGIDSLLDEMNQPSCWFRHRSIAPQGAETSPGPCTCPQRELCHTAEQLSRMRGRAGTASVRVLARRNASLQGTLQLFGAEQAICFRSALELLRLLTQWLGASDEKK